MNNQSSFDFSKIKSWKIYKDFKNWSNGYSDKAIATISASIIAALGLVAILTLFPKRKASLPLANKSKLRRFIATSEWKAVEVDHICPPGLEYKIDMQTGAKLARKIP